MFIKEDILNTFHVEHYFVVTRRISSHLPKKISVWGFFQLASYFLTAIVEETSKKA